MQLLASEATCPSRGNPGARLNGQRGSGLRP
jgi:hypothetical protein